MRRTLIATTILALLALAALPTPAALVSKSYKFKEGVTLDLGVTAEGGLRVDTVEFHFPSGRKILGFGGKIRADVAISNNSDSAKKVGIAIALFDAYGRLVGVASGGSKLLAIKPERQSLYSLAFDDVNNEASAAASFQITIEAK